MFSGKRRLRVQKCTGIIHSCLLIWWQMTRILQLMMLGSELRRSLNSPDNLFLRGPNFGSEYPHGSSQPSNHSYNCRALDLCQQLAHRRFTHIYANEALRHIESINKYFMCIFRRSVIERPEIITFVPVGLMYNTWIAPGKKIGGKEGPLRSCNLWVIKSERSHFLALPSTLFVTALGWAVCPHCLMIWIRVWEQLFVYFKEINPSPHLAETRLS